MAQSVETPEASAIPIDQVDIITNPAQPEWQEGEGIEAAVFIEKGYIRGPDELTFEYATYTPTTEFIVIKRDGVPAGSTRVIHYNPDTGFKTLNDIHQGRLAVDEQGERILRDLDLTQAFEVGTLAVSPEMRAQPESEGRVAVSLYGAIYAEAAYHQTPIVLASFDYDYFQRFKGIFGPGVLALGPPTDYMGSLTIPAVMNVDTVIEHLGKNFPAVQIAMKDIAATVVHN